MIKRMPFVFLVAIALAAVGCQQQQSSTAALEDRSVSAVVEPDRPNILVVIVDDMGMADIGSFGSEIETPNLDQLAFNGTRLTNFSVASTCSPTRSMLLTGVDSHLAGLGNMLEETAPNQKGKPGYEGMLNQRVVTITELLQESGYRTYLSGKWHLGASETSRPSQRGFDKSFSLISGGASHWPDMRPAYAPTPDIKAPYFDGDTKLTALPSNFEYSSQYYVDQLIEYIDQDLEADKPFFGVLSFTAPHWPLQAPQAAIEKYKGRYDQGYEVLLKERFERQLQLGVIPADAKPNTVPRAPTESGESWDELNQQQKLESAKSMEIYAAMIDQVDHHMGRMIDYLKSSKQFKNTLIIFMSDNGAEAHDLDETWPKDLFPKIRATIDDSHDFSYDNMGKPNSYVLYGRGWGKAGSPAYRLHKAFPTEGGMRVAAFVHFPNVVEAGLIDDRQYYVTDLAPTILQLAGVSTTGADTTEKQTEAISGQSLVAYWQDPNLEMPSRIQAFELFGKRMVKDYPWKIVHMPPPYGIDEWQLFNLQEDLLESVDRAQEFPEIVARLKAQWDIYAEQNGVILPDWVSGY